jgi:hypothetical protein
VRFTAAAVARCLRTWFLGERLGEGDGRVVRRQERGLARRLAGCVVAARFGHGCVGSPCARASIPQQIAAPCDRWPFPAQRGPRLKTLVVHCLSGLPPISLDRYSCRQHLQHGNNQPRQRAPSMYFALNLKPPLPHYLCGRPPADLYRAGAAFCCLPIPIPPVLLGALGSSIPPSRQNLQVRTPSPCCQATLLPCGASS